MGYKHRRRSSGSLPVIVYLSLMVVVVFLSMQRGSCADEEQAIRAAENFGFSEVEVLDKSIWFIGFKGCSSSDAALFEVRARNPAGKEVEVGVCVGWPFKGATMRSQ